MATINQLTIQDLESIAVDAYRNGDFATGRAAEANVRAAYRALERQAKNEARRKLARAFRLAFTMRTVFDI